MMTRKGDTHIKYAYVVSGDGGMTMMVIISGGLDSCIEPPFKVFQNRGRTYSIRGVPDDVPEVSYRRGTKGWMDRIIMLQYIKEPRAVKKLPGGRRRILYMDNCSGHALTDDFKNFCELFNTEI